jgi:tripartite-type tricarboxylate transporter receptor subunit TctC
MLRFTHIMRRHLAAITLGVTGLLFALDLPSPARADAVEDFYRGKTITLLIGYTPGGTYDAYGRLVAHFMGNHIPGKPTIVVRNMPGAASRVAAAHLYNVAPRDGTMLATADQSLALAQAMGEKLQFDATKFTWIGNPSAGNNTTVTWHTSGVKSIEDAKAREITMGATGGSTSSQYPRAMNSVLGTKFRIITGYPGGNDINLAMERGEVGGRGSDSWASWKGTRPDWLRDHKINILVQIGLTKAPDLPDVPLLMDLASNPEDRAVLRLLSAPSVIGRPIFGPPDVPAERIKALRQAFDATMKDPAFVAELEKAQLELEPTSGEELERLVNEIATTPKPIAQRLADIIGIEPVK